MRSFKKFAALAAMCFPMVTACGGGGGGGGGDDTQPTPEGSDFSHYVINKLDVPTTSAQIGEFGLDIGGPTSDQPDGLIDNQIGSAISAIVGIANFDVQGSISQSVNDGSIDLLLDFQTSDPTFQTATASALSVLQGSNPNPAPCSGSGSAATGSGSDEVCGQQFGGSASFTATATAGSDQFVSGDITNGVFEGGPGNVSLQITLGGSPITLALNHAHAKASNITAAGVTNAIIGGEISETEFQTVVAPAIATEVQTLVTRDCPYATPPNCACDQCQAGSGATTEQIAGCVAHDSAGSDVCNADTANGCHYDSATTGSEVLDLLDGKGGSAADCKIETYEILNNSTISPLLAPDVCSTSSCTTPDSISIGVQVSAVGATFTVAGEGSSN